MSSSNTGVLSFFAQQDESISNMSQPIWAPLVQLVHMISSPEPFHPTRCRPEFDTSVRSHPTNIATISYL